MFAKFFNAALVAATLAWSLSLSTLLTPLAARAATSGTLIKASQAAVYYVGADGKRYVFPNQKTYMTWYPDFSGVVTISDAELATMTIGGNVTYRPGVRMIKIQTDPKTYAVSHNGTLRWVKTEALATSLYGTTWNQQIDDVSDAFFTNYTLGADINAASDYSPAAETAMAVSINQDKNLANVLTAGALSVKLAATSPGPLTFVGGIGNSMLDFDVTNDSNSPMTLDSLTVHRSGPGSLSDFAGVYLFHGWERISSMRTINSATGDAVFNNVGFVVAPHATETITVLGSFNYFLGAGNQHAFTLIDVRSGSILATGLPLQGSTMTMSSANSGLVTVNKSGSSPFANVRVGGLDQKIGEFRLSVDSTEEMDFYAANLTIGGTVGRSHVSNVVLKYAGNPIATAEYDRFDRATLVLAMPVHMERGASRTFEVFADIAPDTRATSTDTIFTYMDDVTDVTAFGNTFGFASGVTTQTAFGGSYDGVGCVLGGGNCSSVGIEGGQITLTFNGPASHDLPTNGKDQELFNFTMASQSNVEVRNTAFQLDTTSGDLDNDATAFYTDVKLVDTATGTVVAGPLDVPVVAGANTNATLTFTDIYNLSAGQARTFKLTADVASVTPTNSTVRATLNAFGSSSIRNLSNSTFVATSDIVPSTNMIGNAHTVKTPTLNVSAASTPVAQTYIQGSQGVQLAGFNLKAGDSQDMKVTSLTVTCFVDGNLDATFLQGQDTTGETKLCTDILQSAKLWNGTTQLGDTKSPTTSTAPGNGGLLQFTNLNLTVPKGQTLTVVVTGNISGSIANLNDRISLRVTGAASVVAQDPDGNAVIATGTFSVNGPSITMAASGTISVALAPDDSESEAGLVVGGSSNVVLSKYRMTAQNEELKLTKARIGVSVAASIAISSISLYDGATLVGGPTAVDSNGHADFSGMNFVIPKDASKTLTVKASLNAVGPSGAASGTDLVTQLCEGLGGPCVSGLGSSDVGTFEVRGTSAGSSTLLTSFPGVDLTARTKILRKTKPTVSIVALPSSTLTNGTVVISRFTVSADAAEQIALKKITFTSALNNVGGAALALSAAGADSNVREVGQGSNIAGATSYSVPCGTSGTCVIEVAFASEQTIAAGTSKTYELRVTVAGADAAGESASTSLLGDAVNETGWVATPGPGFTLDTSNDSANNGNLRNFLWSDNSAVPHVDSPSAATAPFTGSGDWTNGNLIKVLPSDTQTMTRS